MIVEEADYILVVIDQSPVPLLVVTMDWPKPELMLSRIIPRMSAFFMDYIYMFIGL